MRKLAVREVPRSGPPKALLDMFGISAKSIVENVIKMLWNVMSRGYSRVHRGYEVGESYQIIFSLRWHLPVVPIVNSLRNSIVISSATFTSMKGGDGKRDMVNMIKSIKQFNFWCTTFRRVDSYVHFNIISAARSVSEQPTLKTHIFNKSSGYGLWYIQLNFVRRWGLRENFTIKLFR